MIIRNRRASHDYQLFEKIEVGIVLIGSEVKSVKQGRILLEDAFVKIINDEAFLLGAHIQPYQFADNRDYDPRRTRKLLLHKKELTSLASKMQQKSLTLVPISCYIKRGRIKLKIALAKGKKQFQKKETKKKKDVEREIEREQRVKI